MVRIFILTGAIFIVLGVLLQMMPRTMQFVSRLRMPGDIRVESGNTRIRIPVTTLLIISLIITIILNFLRKSFS